MTTTISPLNTISKKTVACHLKRYLRAFLIAFGVSIVIGFILALWQVFIQPTLALRPNETRKLYSLIDTLLFILYSLMGMIWCLIHHQKAKKHSTSWQDTLKLDTVVSLATLIIIFELAVNGGLLFISDIYIAIEIVLNIPVGESQFLWLLDPTYHTRDLLYLLVAYMVTRIALALFAQKLNSLSWKRTAYE